MNMKAILMSIQSKWLCEILDGEKTVELRKRLPKYYRGWVYLYCTKAKPYLIRFFGRYFIADYLAPEVKDDGLVKNGLVVARVWVDNVEESITFQIFDKPKELGEFYYYKKRLIYGMDCPPYFDKVKTLVRKAPQSWQYIYTRRKIK